MVNIYIAYLLKWTMGLDVGVGQHAAIDGHGDLLFRHTVILPLILPLFRSTTDNTHLHFAQQEVRDLR
jgi:hypothetical protein